MPLCSPQGTYAGADTTTVPNTDDGTQGSQLAKACTLCASGTYRIGDASQNNNVCKKVPAGGQPVVNTVNPAGVLLCLLHGELGGRR